MNARWPVGLPCVCVAWLLVAPLVFRAPEAPAAREIATREPAARSGRSRSPPVPSGPSGTLHTGGACGSGVPGQAPPPPTGTAAGPFGALRTGGAVSLACGLVRVVTNVVNLRCFSCGFLIRCYKRRQSIGFFADNGGFLAWIDDVCNRGPREATRIALV